MDEHAATVERGIAKRGGAFEELRALVIDQRRDGGPRRESGERNVELRGLIETGRRAIDKQIRTREHVR